MDCDPELVKAGTEKKFNIFYGDASRIDILSYCSLNRARLIALCIDDIKTAKKIIANIRILNHKMVKPYRTRKVKVLRAQNASVSLDGRILDRHFPLEITIQPEAITLIIPN